MKRTLILACAALFALFGIAFGASAQEEGVGKAKVEIATPVGLVTKDTPVVLVADVVGVYGRFKAGAICNLRENDVVKILSTSVEGKQMVQRSAKSLLKMSRPSGESCPTGAVVTVAPEVATAWKLAMVAYEADKAAKKGGKR